MSVLEEFSDELYGRLLYGSAPVYLEQPVYLRKVNGKYVPSSWLTWNENVCEALAIYLYEMQFIDLTDETIEKIGGCLKGEVEFFITAAHVVFVPFGKPGYEFLKKKVAKKFSGKGIGEFLYEQLIARTKSRHYDDGVLHGLNAEQKEYVKEFFVNFQTRDDVCYADSKDISTLLCRLYFALDGLQKQGVSIESLEEKYFKPIEKELRDVFLPEKDIFYRVKISDFESRIPVRPPLNKHEEQYLLKLFHLAEPRSRKKPEE